MDKKPHVTFAIFRVVGETLFLYGLLGWIYGVLVQITHPNFLTTGLTHLTPWIRVDTFAVVSFFISTIGFFIWRLTREAAEQN